MQLLKWLSVTDRFYKIYLDKQLAPYGINNSQYMFLIKICRNRPYNIAWMNIEHIQQRIL